jgi:hypothetical protein
MNQAVHDQTLQDHSERAGSATYAIAHLHGEVTLLKQLIHQLSGSGAQHLLDY